MKCECIEYAYVHTHIHIYIYIYVIYMCIYIYIYIIEGCPQALLLHASTKSVCAYVLTKLASIEGFPQWVFHVS